jgi:poly-gamma-glutamate synthesis protein (capsule biosynthesis protein)
MDEQHPLPIRGTVHDRSLITLGAISGCIVAMLIWPRHSPPFADPAAPVDDPGEGRAAGESIAPPPGGQSFSPTPAEPLIRLLFTGDINPGRCPAQLALQWDDFTKPYHFVADALQAADITLGSLDGSISDLSAPEPCPEIDQEVANLIGPTDTIDGLEFAGFDVVSIATNHAMDCGSLGWSCDGRALADTRRHLLAAGILPTGAGVDLAEARLPAILERHGFRFAFLAVNAISGEQTWAEAGLPGTAPLSEESLSGLLEDIRAARAVADVVVVMPHWGIEDVGLPDAAQRTWGRQMIEAGADLVVGNHSHVLQPVETFAQGGVVAYSLGNFVFDQRPEFARRGAVFEAIFRGRVLVSWRLIPIVINPWFQPVLAGPEAAGAILAEVEAAGKILSEE